MNSQRSRPPPSSSANNNAVASRSGGALINVGVLVRYADMSINQGRFRWPATISEREAIERICQTQSSKDLQEMTEVSITQVPRAGVGRILWLDKAPNGKYKFNQHMYGEGGIQDQLNKELRNQKVEYDPDLNDVTYQDSIDSFLTEQAREKAEAEAAALEASRPPVYDPERF